MDRLHLRVLNEFAELILNFRMRNQQRQQLKYSSVTGLWQLKGGLSIEQFIPYKNKDVKIVIQFYLQRLNTKLLVEIWVLDVIVTNEQFVLTPSEYSRSQRQTMNQARSVVSLLVNTPIHANINQFDKYKLIHTLNEEHTIPAEFKSINFPVIPCSTIQVAYFQLKMYYREHISMSPTLQIIPKLRQQQSPQGLWFMLEQFKQKQKRSLQLQQTIEYFN